MGKIMSVVGSESQYGLNAQPWLRDTDLVNSDPEEEIMKQISVRYQCIL